MTRQEHLEWCKQRALVYLECGDTQGAFASFTSDLSKHPETENHAGLRLGIGLLMAGHLDGAQMKTFINGFN